ncbi:M15 family metallopeptidase [Frigidibacter sp. MR17.14]|uniref:M15 family metallopeptidase n=1 Tax=Frigidibacter sp. MR17.14 TaxID=3126509 RepID=UPI003012AF51
MARQEAAEGAPSSRLEAWLGFGKVFFGTGFAAAVAAAFPYLTRQAELGYRAQEIALEHDAQLREFLYQMGSEGRSGDIDVRIRLAEFYSFVSTDPAEVKRWMEFLAYLKTLLREQTDKREAALRVKYDPTSTPLELALAEENIFDVSQRLTPSRLPSTGWSATAPLDRREVEAMNGFIEPARSARLVELFGDPGATGDKCGPPGAQLAARMGTEDVGPFTVTLQAPALASLRAIFGEIRATDPDLYAAIGSADGLCVRYIRGTTTQLSNHSFGTSIDLTIDGQVGPWGDGRTLTGLAELAPYFTRHGWYWGAGFNRTEPGHFEAGRVLVESWAAAPAATDTVAPVIED